MNSDLDKYIQKIEKNPETGKDEVWLRNLPNDESLFDEIITAKLNYADIVVINDVVNLVQQNINNSFIFPKCVFHKDVNFNFCTFEKAISFTNCVFNANVSFGGSTFSDTFHFTGNEVIGSTNFWKATFHKMVVFSETKFKGDENDFSDVTFIDDVFAEKIEVAEKINFSNSRFEQNVYFPQIKAKDFNFCNVIVSESSNTYDRNINHIFKRGVDFNYSEFIKVDFSDTKFKKNVRFHSCKFYKNVSFYNTTFEKLADFYLSEFYDSQQFHLTDFFDRAIFSNATFHKEIQFIYCRTYIDSSISFESAIFKRILDISRANLGKNINFWNIEIDDEGEQYVFENYENSKYKDDFGEHSKVPSIYKQIRESYRIIKNSCIERNDRIGATEFHKKEMDVYKRELKHKTGKVSEHKKSKTSYFEIISIVVIFVFLSLYLFFQQIKEFYWIFLISFIFFLVSSKRRQKITRKNIAKTFKENKLIYGTFCLIQILINLFFFIMVYYFPNSMDFIAWIILCLSIVSFIMLYSYFTIDEIILRLNKHSNNFGTNWVNGVVFIFWVGIISYLLVLSSLSAQLEWNIYNLNAWSNALKHFLEIINVAHWEDIKPFGVELNGLSYLFLFIGRIFIGYGYYQTIQAFRKFGKSS